MATERQAKLFPTAGVAYRFCKSHGLEISMANDNLWPIAEALYNAEYGVHPDDDVVVDGDFPDIKEWISNQSMACFISRLPKAFQQQGVVQHGMMHLDIDEDDNDGFVLHQDLGVDVGAEFFLTRKMISTAKLNREDDSITFDTDHGAITLRFYNIQVSKLPVHKKTE